MAPYFLALNKPALIFCPPVSSESESHVVQVTIKTRGVPNVDELATFFLARHDITNAVESLLLAHIRSPLPTEVILEDEDYSLHGKRMEWKYGKGLKLTWGDEGIVPCGDKWVFAFKVKDWFQKM